MQGRTTKAAALGAALLLLAAPAFAEPLAPFDFSSPRERAMGGSHVALADDYSVLLTNPAGLASAPREALFADLGIRAMGPVFNFIDLFVNSADAGTAVIDLLAANGYKLYAGIELSGPLALGYADEGLGFGLFNKTSFVLNAASAVNIGVFLTEDILLSGGYAFRFELGGGHLLDLGIGAKGFARGNLGKSMGFLEVADLMSDPMAILGEDFTLATGIGCDLGLRWSWESLAAGLVCRDLFSPAIVAKYDSLSGFIDEPSTTILGDPTYEFLKRSLDIGFAWTPELGKLGRILDSITVAIDYRDILDFFALVPRNAILKLGLGVEARMLDIVAVRAGINEALLSAGVGIDIGVLKLGFSVLGTELGIDPGVRPNYNLILDFSFRY